jgi:hypothetical protein
MKVFGQDVEKAFARLRGYATTDVQRLQTGPPFLPYLSRILSIR